MARHASELADAQWRLSEPLLPKPKPSPQGGRRPLANRPVFEGILWVLRAGARWKNLPPQYPSPSTCWRRLRDWGQQGVWLEAWRAFLAKLDQNQQLKRAEVFADDRFAPAKKGALAWAKPNAARARRGWWGSMAPVFPWETTWTVPPRRRSSCCTSPLQDGRPLRPYRRRWIGERTFAWLGNFRRLVVRYDRNLSMYQAFFHVACLLITFRHLGNRF